ncbi:MAG: hypothetical protein AUI53_04620 [Acidobacteria bacterium 13_1_40CM_2_60_7]|nr:MAG: hypothetical protein AUH88_02135 [Acidobacteria bacterium 13_1_40CM_4_61_5]OLD61702.1 MAG: hypothetical protein AUI53_04620 [Acidobacteria bacterium 13_1_40CM_2_60_7]PYU05716.1 MAG: hypothetical protein DMG33_10195 [Acidobacteriota bacterium]
MKDVVGSFSLEYDSQGATSMNIASSFKPVASAAVGLILLTVPSYFIIASVLRQNPPGLPFLGSPIILLGALFIALTLNTLSTVSVNLRSGTPYVLSVSVSLRLWNLTVIGITLALLGVLLGYAFVENFQSRPAG